MQRLLLIFLLAFSCLNITGCAHAMNHEDTGTVTGGLIGALIGSAVGEGDNQIFAMAAGSIAGALIGGSIGRGMDRYDYIQLNEALEECVIGEPAYWHNRRTGYTYRVVPIRNVRYRHYRYCREYRTIVKIGDKKRTMYGTACRQADGSWRAMN